MNAGVQPLNKKLIPSSRSEVLNICKKVVVPVYTGQSIIVAIYGKDCLQMPLPSNVARRRGSKRLGSGGATSAPRDLVGVKINLTRGKHPGGTARHEMHGKRVVQPSIDYWEWAREQESFDEIIAREAL
jgi:hypothetical protein